jgi:SWI/SNF-related matrix-associated actin-dependent regulator 1 of chromatin subfamily A
MGLGKTIQAIATLAHVEGPACIVCPAYLKQNWYAEIDKFLPGAASDKAITVLSYEKFGKFPPSRCSILIFDEAHYLKNMQSKRTKFAHAYVSLNKPKYLLLLSGTPIKNRVTEFYSLMKLCSYNPRKTSGLPLTKGFTVFANYLCHSQTMNTPYGTAKKYYGLKNKSLLLKYLKGKYFTATNDKPLPTLNRQNIIVDAIKNKQLVEQLEEDFANNHISTAKKNIAIEKAGFTAKYVNDCISSSEKPILVFSDHIESCFAIKTELNAKGVTSVTVITGSTPSDQRHKIVVDFQQGLIDVLVCTIGSMSTGFTLTATNRVVFNDLSWCPADNEQAEKRIHRIGQMKNCYVIRILSEGIDRKIIEVLQEKQNTLDKVYSS